MGETSTIIRGPGGRFLPGTIPPNIIKSSETARTLVRSRWDRKRESFQAGITQAMRDNGLLPPGDDHNAAAWQVIGNKAATLLLDETNARNFASLLHEVRATVQDKDDPTQAQAVGTLAGGMLGAFLAAIQAAKDNALLNCSYQNQEDQAIDAMAQDADGADDESEG